MKYAGEIIGLMGAMPGRKWRMVQIVRHISDGKKPDLKERRTIRKGVMRALEALIDMGSVDKTPPGERGGPAWYSWAEKVRH